MHRMSSLSRRGGAFQLPPVIALAAFLVSAVPPAEAIANDSAAHLAAGGLVLSRNDAIEMASEDLFVSTGEIRVSYRFVNRTEKDVTTLVAFPLPDIGAPSEEDNFIIPEPDEATNFLDFETTVDSMPVEMSVEQRAIALGVDRTELLRSLSLPIAPHSRAAADMLGALPEETLTQLSELGMIAYDTFDLGDGMQRHVRPLWLARTTYFWKQTFPAMGEVHIEHRYRPSVGGSAQSSVGTDFADKDTMDDYAERYCMEAGFLRAAEALQKRQPKSGTLIVTELRLEYVLTTGANWAGSIRNFHLTVDKGDPQNLVSYCMDGVRKTSPTRFETTKEYFWPRRNLEVLLLVPVVQP